MRGALTTVQSGGRAGEWPWAPWEQVRGEEVCVENNVLESLMALYSNSTSTRLPTSGFFAFKIIKSLDI